MYSIFNINHRRGLMYLIYNVIEWQTGLMDEDRVEIRAELFGVDTRSQKHTHTHNTHKHTHTHTHFNIKSLFLGACQTSCAHGKSRPHTYTCTNPHRLTHTQT